MSRSIDKAEKNSVLLVSFAYGTNYGTFSKYAGWDLAVDDYVATPQMNVELPDNTGTFQEKEARIVLPLDAFTSRISDGRPFSPTYVTVIERVVSHEAGPAASELTLFRGQVQRAIRNFQGRSNFVALGALGVKGRLDVPLGLQCNHHDEARLFGPMSGLSQASFQQTGQIASASGRTVFISTPNSNITAPTSPGGDIDRYWERGFLQKDGLRIGTYIWNRLDDPTKFVLRESPPADWVLAGGASILFVPGTHATIEDARAVWDNEEHFLGIGWAMLDYNPIIENPS